MESKSNIEMNSIESIALFEKFVYRWINDFGLPSTSQLLQHYDGDWTLTEPRQKLL